ncbi:MAG: MFS transporter [Kiritimatiellae bacterium]|nr:MFS transporter [Kiritimatiellia bacterium]
MKRWMRAVLPAFLLAISVGQIYAFTNFSDPIARHLACGDAAVAKALLPKVQFAFSLGIFFLGMGAAFFGKIVEKNIRLSTIVGTALFLSGLCVTGLGVSAKSMALIYLGYGLLIGLGTGIIYISPVKTMMLWFPEHKAIAAALPIISFGLGSTLSTVVYKGFSAGGPGSLFSVSFLGLYGWFGVGENAGAVARVFRGFAVFYAPAMIASAFLLKKPKVQVQSFGHDMASLGFKYSDLMKNRFFWQAWLFMFLNISAGLCLIPLAKQMMKSPAVGYSESLATAVVALAGVMNGGGRFLFAWWSDRLSRRIDILLFILAISAGVMTLSFWPPVIGLAMLVINACYGAGFSVIPAILADRFGMTDISKIHGAVLSAWGFAGLFANQFAIFVANLFGGYGEGGHGYAAVVAMLVAVYFLNLLNASSLRAMTMAKGER